MKLFGKSLLKACEFDNLFPPAPFVLIKYDNEIDKLKCSIIHILKDQMDCKAKIILGNSNSTIRNTINKAITKTCRKAISGKVVSYWTVLEKLRNKIINT